MIMEGTYFFCYLSQLKAITKTQIHQVTTKITSHLFKDANYAAK